MVNWERYRERQNNRQRQTYRDIKTVNIQGCRQQIENLKPLLEVGTVKCQQIKTTNVFCQLRLADIMEAWCQFKT